MKNNYTVDVNSQSLPPGLRVGISLGVLTQLFQGRVGHTLGALDLSYSQFTVLSHLQRTGESTIGEIAVAIEINQPGATKIVQRLHDKGLVEIESDPSDGRRRLVGLTESGGQELQQGFNLLGADLAAWFDDWPDRELDAFAAGAEKLAGWLDQNRP